MGMNLPDLPSSLYDPKDTSLHGLSRTLGYLMRIRVEYLVEARSGLVGRRRATHVGALIEVANNAYAEQFQTGYFSKELKDRVALRLRRAHLQDQEKHFRDIYTWGSRLSKERIREEIRANLLRHLGAQETKCLRAGIELHVLFDKCMSRQCGSYLRVIEHDDNERYPAIAAAFDRLMPLVRGKLAA